MIRTQNATWIDILPGTEEHSISNKRMREFGKILFSKDLY